MKVRRYLRGSGRVLAFVFIASVIWLLFDMAALRISINDVNSHMLKERLVREREVFKQQSRVTQLMRRGFKHPVQRVDSAVTHAGKGPLSSDFKLSQVYRQEDKKWGQMLRRERVNVLKADRSTSALFNHQEKAALQNVTLKQSVPAKKKAVILDLNGAQLEESNLMNIVVSNVTQGSPSAQKNLHDPLPTAEKKPYKDTNEAEKSANTPDLKTNKTETKSGSNLSQPQAEEAHPAKITPKPPNKDVKEEVNIIKEKNLQSDVNAVTRPLKPTNKLQTGDNSTGLHKVLSLDMTLAPRDVNAVGQYGQAAFVASNEDAEVRKRWDEGHFNVYLSDKIPVDRAIPDTRPEM